jgi:hypothetical protein
MSGSTVSRSPSQANLRRAPSWTARAHAFTVEVGAKSPPDLLRLESLAVSFLGD